MFAVAAAAGAGTDFTGFLLVFSFCLLFPPTATFVLFFLFLLIRLDTVPSYQLNAAVQLLGQLLVVVVNAAIKVKWER